MRSTIRSWLALFKSTTTDPFWSHFLLGLLIGFDLKQILEFIVMYFKY